MSAKTYYTLEEAAKMLKLHPQTLRRWIREGKLSAKRFGKQFRLRLEDIEQAAQPATEELSGFDQTALVALTDLWNNAEDAVYDNWKEIYGVKKR